MWLYRRFSAFIIKMFLRAGCLQRLFYDFTVVILKVKSHPGKEPLLLVI